MSLKQPKDEISPGTTKTTLRSYDRRLKIIAWIATLLISVVPDIAFDVLAGTTPSWLVYVKMGLLLVLCLATLLWKNLRPLVPSFIVMTAFFALEELRQQINFTWPALQRLFGASGFDARMQAEQAGKLVVSLGMIALMLVLGYKRRDFFLRLGDLRAPIKPVALMGFPKADPWYRFALQWGF